jgi:hypothetical protein
LGNLYGSSHNLILDLIRQWSRWSSSCLS